MKTLSQLKKDAKSGNLSAELIFRQGTTDIPASLKGVRKMIDANSVGITFLNSNKKKSELRIDSASLIEYTDTHITLFNPALRDLTMEEQSVFDKWELMRDIEKEEIDMLTDGSSQFHKRKWFFTDAGYEYLLGHDVKQGKRFDCNTKKVFDNKIKGEMSMQYRIVQ